MFAARDALNDWRDRKDTREADVGGLLVAEFMLLVSNYLRGGQKKKG